jgi:hypothetical protein
VVAVQRPTSGDYYEDADPRFAEQPPAASMVPAALAPGYSNVNSSSNLQPAGGLNGSSSHEDLQSGARSPATSDQSNFTSVSQRGVNPRWNGQPGYGAPMQNRRPVNAPQQQRDILLNSNPDFQLPGGRGGPGGARGGGMRGIPGMVPNSAYPGGTAL